jgi:HK97 family phage major capsid protein
MKPGKLQELFGNDILQEAARLVPTAKRRLVQFSKMGTDAFDAMSARERSAALAEVEAACDEIAAEARRLEAPANEPITSKTEFRSENKMERTIKTGPAQDRSYVGMFYPERRDVKLDAGGFKTQEEFLTVVESGRWDERLSRASMLEGEPAAGGFAVPEEFARQWLDTALPEEVIRPNATVWPMASKTRTVPGWDSSDHSDATLFGGFALQWLAEEGTGTKQTGKLRKITLTAHKGAIFCDISNELRDDGMGFEAQLENALRSSLSFGLDYYFINGTGAGQPKGLQNDVALVQVSKETGQESGSIYYENLAKMWARLYPAGRKRCVWLANSDAIPQLMQVSVALGTAGELIPIFKESSGNYSIFGRPVLFSECMPSVGSENDILLVDLSQYSIGMRKEISLDRSNIPGWTQDLMSYRVIVRVDGQGTWNAPITPVNGSTLSWLAGLEARA